VKAASPRDVQLQRTHVRQSYEENDVTDDDQGHEEGRRQAEREHEQCAHRDGAGEMALDIAARGDVLNHQVD
jgi:hypothetical protein